MSDTKDFQNETREKFEILRQEFIKLATQQRRFEHVMDVIIHALVTVCIMQNISPDELAKRMSDTSRSADYWTKILKQFLGNAGEDNSNNLETRASQMLRKKK